MKIRYNPTTVPYTAVGKWRVASGSDSAVSVVDLSIKPKSVGIIVKHQKRKFSRFVRTLTPDDPALVRFNREAANILLEEFDLEFDSKNVPLFLTDHAQIWKRWLTKSDILRSKYNGAQVERFINQCTVTLSDEKLFKERLLHDFMLSEMYLRQIYTITFDERTYTARRSWKETVFGLPLVFEQECRLTLGKNQDRLEIKGKADVENNRKNLDLLCKNQTFTTDQITSIEQKSVYSATNISFMPDRIESSFTINAKDSFLKKIDLELDIKKTER